MKDLDFDELDKAVNSLMGTKTDDSQSDGSSTLLVSTSEAPSVDVNQNVSPVDDADADQETQKPKTLAVKRSGRFMDVVHPSSDMRSTQRPTMPSRVGVNLAPVSSQVPSEDVSPDAPVDKDTDWPDPIDMHESTTADTKESDGPLLDAITEPGNLVDTEPTTVAVVPDQSALTPFLPDAKVDKRPLGGVPNDTPDEPDTVDTADLPELNAEDQLPSESLQAELKDDIVAIESDATNQSATTAEVASADIEQSEKVEVSESEPKKVEETHSSPAVQSITQQYKPQPSTGDATHAALYDGAAENLSHPPKKKSGWLAVFIVLLLVALGAGGAAALYFLGYI